jgi:hypothetical protein
MGNVIHDPDSLRFLVHGQRRPASRHSARYPCQQQHIDAEFLVAEWQPNPVECDAELVPTGN